VQAESYDDAVASIAYLHGLHDACRPAPVHCNYESSQGHLPLCGEGFALTKIQQYQCGVLLHLPFIRNVRGGYALFFPIAYSYLRGLSDFDVKDTL